MSQYLPKSFRSFRGNINVKVDLSNYATKTDLKNVTHVDISSFALKTNIANLKAEVAKLDIDKLASDPVDLSKLSDVVKNDNVKKSLHDKLVIKVNNIDSSDFVLKTKYKVGTKTPDVSNLVKKTTLTELENKTTDISNLGTKTALTVVENKIPSVSSLAKKIDYNTKTTDSENKLNNHNHDKYIDTSEFDRLAADVFNARLAQANLITKTDFGDNLPSLSRKITQNKTKHLLVENELNKLKTFDSSYFTGKGHFEEVGTQNNSVFHPLNKYFKVITNTDYVSSWKSKGLSAESIKPPATSDNSLTPVLKCYGTKTRVKFTGSSLKQPKISYTHGRVVSIFIVFELDASSSHNNDPTLKKCLFGAVTLTKNTNIDNYGYSGHGVGFDSRSSFSFPDGGFGQSVLMFEVDMSFSAHIDNKKKDILLLGKGPTQELEHTLTAEKMYSINFTVTRKKFYLSLHYNGVNSYLFVNGTEI